MLDATFNSCYLLYTSEHDNTNNYLNSCCS